MNYKCYPIKRTMCFTIMFISTVYSCPFSSTEIAEDNEQVVNTDSSVSSMCSKIINFFIIFFR